MRGASKTDYLDILGATCLILFAFAIWPPLALAAVGAFALVASWRASQ
jgi:nitrate reductase NapE component